MANRTFRCMVLFLAAVSFLGMPSAAQRNNSSQILFICEHGNVKSVIAMSWFNRLAEQRGLKFRAIARGTSPNSTTVPAAIEDGLRADGFDLRGFRPTALSGSDLRSFYRAIIIGTDLPREFQDIGATPEVWNDVPPATVDFNAARDSLKEHVTRLLDQLENSPPEKSRRHGPAG